MGEYIFFNFFQKIMIFFQKWAPQTRLLRRKHTRLAVPVSGHPNAPSRTFKHWLPLYIVKSWSKSAQYFFNYIKAVYGVDIFFSIFRDNLNQGNFKNNRAFFIRYSVPTFDYDAHRAWGTESDNKNQHSFEMTLNKLKE